MRRRRSPSRGSLTLPAKKFYEIVRSLPETDIRIAEDKGGVQVAADRFDSRMQTLPREDFPTLPESGGTRAPRCRAASVKEMVAKTQFAITGEDTRFFLNGALFVLQAPRDEPGRDRRPSSRPRDAWHAKVRTRRTRTRARPSCRRRRSASLPGCSTKATAISPTSVAKTTCSSMSAAGC